MNNNEQSDFERWAKELDSRCENRPVVYAFHLDECDRVLTPEERLIVQNNLASYDRQFAGSARRCANPLCRYPLMPDEGFYVGEVGQCCWLCHGMDAALRQTRQQGAHFGTIFEWFDAAHKEWKLEQERIDRIKKNTDRGFL